MPNTWFDAVLKGLEYRRQQEIMDRTQAQQQWENLFRTDQAEQNRQQFEQTFGMQQRQLTNQEEQQSLQNKLAAMGLISSGQAKPGTQVDLGEYGSFDPTTPLERKRGEEELDLEFAGKQLRSKNAISQELLKSNALSLFQDPEIMAIMDESNRKRLFNHAFGLNDEQIDSTNVAVKAVFSPSKEERSKWSEVLKSIVNMNREIAAARAYASPAQAADMSVRNLSAQAMAQGAALYKSRTNTDATPQQQAIEAVRWLSKSQSPFMMEAIREIHLGLPQKDQGWFANLIQQATGQSITGAPVPQGSAPPPTPVPTAPPSTPKSGKIVEKALTQEEQLRRFLDSIIPKGIRK